MTCPLRRFRRAFREQPFVDVPFDVGFEQHPRLGLDEVDDQALQGGRVLDVLTRFLEDLPQHATLLPQLLEHVTVMHFEVVTILRQEASPDVHGFVALYEPTGSSKVLSTRVTMT